MKTHSRIASARRLLRLAAPMLFVSGLLLASSALATNVTFNASLSTLTTTSPGASCVVVIDYSPTNMAFATSITSGDAIVNTVTPTYNAGKTRVTFTVAPKGNKSGAATLQVVATVGTFSETNSYDLVFAPYPPEITNITNKSMDEDTVLDVTFTVSDADTDLADLDVWAESSNTVLIDTAGLVDTGTGGTRTLTLTPKANRHGTATITVHVEDPDGGADSDTFTLTVNSVPDVSALTTTPMVNFTDQAGVTNAFSDAVVTDADHNVPTTSYNEMLTLTATLSNELLATFSNDSTSYTASGTPAQIQTALRALGVKPIPRALEPGSVGTVMATISVQGNVDALVTNNIVELRIEMLNNAPFLSMSMSTDTITEGQTVRPFVLDAITDMDYGDDEFTLAASLVNPEQAYLGALSNTNLLSGTFINLRPLIAGLEFASNPNVMTTATEQVAFRFELADRHGGVDVVTNWLTIVQAQTPPTILGIPVVTLDKKDADAAFILLPTVFVSDPDMGGLQQLRATLALSDPGLGVLSQTTFPLQSDDDLVAALRTVTFTPVRGAVPPEASATTVVILTVVDAAGVSTQNNNLSIRITGVNNAPQILNVPPLSEQPLLIPPIPPIRPFANLGLSSDDTNSVLFTIALDNPAKGALENLGGFSADGGGVYTMAGSTNAILGSLTNLAYVLDSGYLFPVDDPGGTTFTLSARDGDLLTSTLTLAIQVQLTPRNHLVTRVLNDGQPGSLAYALAKAGNNDAITFALPEYPATIRMSGGDTTALRRNLVIKGPGADLLTISGDSNGDDVPDRQIFCVYARVTIEGVALSRGTATFGGAISVQPTGELILRHCAITDCIAAECGGAIDVDGGKLTIENSFIGFNALSPETGLGGGAGISIYSDYDARIVNTTFHGNIQANEGGVGGGAFLFQTQTSSPVQKSAFIEHCTFAGNVDVAGVASAVLCMNNNAIVCPANSIFADFSGRNLNVYGGGNFISLGGNLCDDSTKVVRTPGDGASPYLLDHLHDTTETDPLLAPLVTTGAATPHHPLLPLSPAIGGAFQSTATLDQRGALRDAEPDAGAVEFDALRRLAINEIQCADGALHFIEIVAPRDGVPIDLAPYALFVDGVKVHAIAEGRIVGTNALFAAGETAASAGTLILPGYGMVVAFTNAPLAMTSAINPTPVYGASETNASIKSLKPRGSAFIALDALASPVARQSWVGNYLDPATGTNDLDTAGHSLALAPQMRGFALLPHGAILPGPFEGADPVFALAGLAQSPGADILGTPFGQPNAEPFAREDLFTVTEDAPAILDVLANDFDGDGNDRLVIVDISAVSEAGGDIAATNSAQGAAIRVDPAATPLRGSQIAYDPRDAATLQQLPVGVELIDSFHYELIDIGRGPIEAYADTGSNTLVTATHHRLATGDAIVISGASVSDYNGTFVVTTVDDDTFTIPVAFTGASSPLGIWETVEPRLPTQRDEARVNVRVIGRNDPPVATADVITNVTEETTIRVMIRPEMAGLPLVFPDEPSSSAVLSAQNLLANDDDIDSDDTWSSLEIVGILGAVHPISGFTGTEGAAPVTVHAPAHGLASGTEILIANYGGHPSYTGYHVITVVDDDTFTIPVSYVDDHAQKGMWAILNDANRLQITTAAGAPVALTLRDDPSENHLVYRAGDSDFLDGLAEGERFDDTFWYAVEDSHGAIAIGPVTVEITGVNDAPAPGDDPGGLGILDPLVSPSNTLEQVLANGLDVMYALPAASDAAGRTDLHVLDLSGTLPGTLVLPDFFTTDEDTPLAIPAADLLANDADIDRLDTLFVDSVAPFSREAGAVAFAAATVTYDPTASSNLQALARGEMRIDTFAVAISDGMTGGIVTSLVSVLVVGVNDTPTANPDLRTTNEDEILTLDPLLNDVEIDVNGTVPDDRLRIVPAAGVPNPGLAQVDLTPTNAIHDATVSALLNQLADWQVFTNVFDYTVTDNSFLFAVEDAFHVPVDSPAVLLNVLANDRDFTDAVGALVIVGAGPAAQGGAVSVVSNGQFIAYQPAAGFVGDDTFRYTIQNALGDVQNGIVVVRAVVPAINGVLHALNDTFAVAAGETVVMPVAANDGMLPEGSAGLQVTELIATSSPGQPRLVGNAFVFDATNGATSLTFTYAVTAGGSTTSRADVAVAILERRGTLTIGDDFISVQPGSFSNPLDVLGNDGLVGEPTGHLRIAALLDPAAHGTLAIDATGCGLVYTPDSSFIGVERVRYLATDGAGGTGTGTVAIAVGRVEPLADFFKLEAANTNAVVVNVLANDRTLPNPPGTLTIQSVSPASTAIGAMALGAAPGTLRFTATGTIGQTNFQYVAADASNPARLSTGTVSVLTVAPGIYANPDRFRVLGGGADYVLDVLPNDRSFPVLGRTLSITAVGTGGNAPSASGNVVIENNKLVYTPAEGFFGEESFTYRMSDSVASDVAQVTVSVTRGDLVASADDYTVFYEEMAGGAVRAFTLPVTLNDRILPSMDQMFAITTLGVGPNAPSVGGSVVIASDGLSLVYRPVAVPTPEFIETFTYEIADDAGRRASARVRVCVQDRRDQLAAVTQDDAFAVARNSLHNLLPVLANDAVLPGTASAWSVAVADAPTAAGGVVALQGSVMRYSPPRDFVGVDTFTYTVSDGLGGTGNATVRVRVGDLPTVTSRFVALAASTSNAFDVIDNDALTPAYVGEYALDAVFGATAGGSVSLGSGSNVLYAPDAAYAGIHPYTEEFFYTVLDDSGIAWTGRVDVVVHDPASGRDTGTVTLVVEGRNDAPEIHNATTNAPITDKETALVFTGVTFVEYDEQLQEPLDATVAIDDAAKGALTNLGAFADAGGGVYVLSNVTAAAATDAIRLLRYVPVENRITVPTNEVVTFTITVSDRKAPPVTDVLTTLEVWAVNDVPLIAGTESEQRFYYKLPVRPFFAVEITEVDDLALQPLVVTISIVESAQGVLQNLGDFASLGGGLYRATNVTAAAATQQLRALEFVHAGAAPAAGVVGLTTHLGLAVDDGFAPLVTDSATSVIAMQALAGALDGANATTAGSLGLSVDIGTDFAVAGAPTADIQGTDSGAAYVYRLEPGSTNVWKQWRRLLPASVAAGNHFGRSVAIGDDFLAVGASEQVPVAGQTGSVYLFRRQEGGADNWGEWMRIAPTNLPGSSRFGYAVALQGDLLAVGAPGAGAVFLFQRHHGGSNAWGEILRWSPSGAGANGADFGWSVALSDSTLIVGAPKFNGNTATTGCEGRVFHFQRDEGGSGAWGLRQSIPGPDTSTVDFNFGWSVAVVDNRLAVGAPLTTVGSVSKAGRVFLYERAVATDDFANTLYIDRISDPERNFGYSVALDGERLLVGAPENATDPYLGAAFLFAKHSGHWTQTEKFLRPAGNVANLFGRAVAMRNGNGIVGAPTSRIGDTNTDQGHVFFYRFDYTVLDPKEALTPRQIWDQFNFGDEIGNPWNITTLWSGAADPDGDGRSNDEEYAFMGDPLVTQESGIVWISRDAVGNWVLEYERRTNDPALVFTLEASTDLQTWSDWSSSILSEISTPLTAESEWTTVVLQPAGSDDTRFFRVKASW